MKPLVLGAAHESIVNGTRLVWGELGAGPPLVLLHGLWDSHRAWRRCAPLLAPHFRLLMLDLPGHGWSGRPDAPYTMTWFADMVGGWMDAIGVARAHVCGHSFGGGIAQCMLLTHRARIDRLALVDAGGLGRELAVTMRLATVPLLGPLVTPFALRVGSPIVARYMPQLLGHMEPAEAEVVLRMCGIPGSARAFQRALAAVVDLRGQRMQMAERVHEIPDLPPIALFWGANDPMIPVHHATRFLERLSGVSLAAYPGCGHFPQLDEAPAFARDLTAYLNEPARPAARLRGARPRPAPASTGSRPRTPARADDADAITASRRSAG
ncbi:MAG TPA: alpha/beta fold hydrolase [Polyangia bacterium]|jgi:pimeloyl-ACP methyl ester carboxylesterase